MSRLCLLALFVCVASAAAEENEPASGESKHALLKQFVGEWDCENEGFIDPDTPFTFKSTMSGHMIGKFWAVVVVKAEGEGPAFQGQATFGYDALKKKKYVGMWSDSTSGFLWQYEGAVKGNKLALDTEGPNPEDPTKMVKARDTWQFKDKDTILLTTEFEGPDGKMVTVMKATCRRKK